MKIIKNEKLIKRNARIGQFTSLFALVVLAAGMYVSFKMPNQFGLAIAALIAGFALSQVGIYFGNRWGRQPRPDQMLDNGLKGLPGDYTIYHYTTPASHLLIGPAGVWVLMTYHQRGTVTFSRNRWRLRGGGFMQNYMRIFGQEGLGRPDLEANSEASAIRGHFEQQFEGEEIPQVQAALVFTNPDMNIQADEAPIPSLPLKKLKDFIRKAAKSQALPAKRLEQIKAALPE
jgi:hypothetical protein